MHRQGLTSLRLLGAFLGVLCMVYVDAKAPVSDHQLSTRAINACDLLSDAEVAAMIHAPVDPGQRHDTGTINSEDQVAAGAFSSTCLWRLHSESPPPTDPNLSLGGASYVILNVMQWPAGSNQAKRFLENFRDAAKRGEISQTPVPLKIGDEGLWWGDGVAACKGDRSFGISVHLVGGRDRERGIEQDFASKIASRL
jgi:hypothetical protein